MAPRYRIPAITVRELATDRPDWMMEGLCAGAAPSYDIEPIGTETERQALNRHVFLARKCMECPVFRECESFADENRGLVVGVLAGRVYVGGGKPADPVRRRRYHVRNVNTRAKAARTEGRTK